MARNDFGSGGSGTPLNPAAADVVWYDRVLISTLQPQLQINRYAEMRGIPANEGENVNWRQFGRLPSATTPLAEGSPGTPTTVVINEVTATVGQYGDWVEMTDQVVDKHIDPVWTQTVMLQGPQVALTLDDLAQAVIIAGTNATYDGTGGGRANIASDDLPSDAGAQEVIAELRTRHVPYVTDWIAGTDAVGTVPGSPAYIGIVTPQIVNIMRQQAKLDPTDPKHLSFVEASDYASDPARLPGEVGKIFNIRLIETTNGGGYVFPGAGSASADVAAIPVFGMGAYARASIGAGTVSTHQRFPGTSPTDSDPLAQLGSTGWKAYYVAAILDQDRIERWEFATGGTT